MPKFSHSDNPYYQKKKQPINNQVDRQEVTSQKSGMSSKSARQMLFQRSNMNLVESRLSSKNMSKSRLQQNNNQSRTSFESEKYRVRRSRISTDSRGRHQLYSRSADKNIGDSKSKILGQIAQKLKNRQKIIYDSSENYRIQTSNETRLGKNRSYSGNKVYSTQVNFEIDYNNKILKQPSNKMVKNKLSKLENLLKEIKKSNREAVYITKRTEYNDSDLEPYKKYDEKQKERVPSQLKHKKRGDIQQLGKQLKMVKEQLKEVKQKNQEILSITHSRSNFDSASEISMGSQPYYKNRLPDYNREINERQQFENQNHFHKKENEAYIILQNNLIQPCFACGCTCKSRNKTQLKH